MARAFPSPAGGRGSSVYDFPVAASSARAAYVAGTFDTKGRELFFLCQCLERLGLRVVTVDLATSGRPSPASIHPREVARHHPQGESAVFSTDRGNATAAMALAFEAFLATRRDLGGIISAGGSGGTSMATQGMRALPIGCPKMMVSTMASGDTRPYVGPSDICMMYSVTDVQGINRISEQVLSNAAHALAGMIAHPPAVSDTSKPAIGMTMFGVTTPCVQAVAKRLEAELDCLVFHATGVGGQSMEKLADSGLLSGAIDVSTTEIADEIAGGTLSAGPTRLDVFARHALPYVGSCGALDMVNFGAWDTVPERFKARKLYRHNTTVTLMRTTIDENRAIGEFIAAKLNAMRGPVRFLIPEGGVSAIDKPGQPFHDPEADRMLFATIEQRFRSGPDRKLQRLPLHINDEAFADALVAAWHEVSHASAGARRA
ncbi:MAG TPA: Tm-1-like ATP-binding domain-containing protein [Burkholderiaceae bacterium]